MEKFKVFVRIRRNCATHEEMEYIYNVARQILDDRFFEMFLVSAFGDYIYSLPYEVKFYKK